MTIIDRRVARLEQGTRLAVHRPAGTSSDEFFALMFEALAAVPRGASAEEHSRASGPWLAAMTHTELKEMAAAIEAIAPQPGSNRTEPPTTRRST